MFFDSEPSQEVIESCPRNPTGGPHDYQEDKRTAEMVCRHCGAVGHKIYSTALPKVFEDKDEKNLTSDPGKQIGQMGTRMGSVYSSSLTSLQPGLTARDRTLHFTTRRRAKDRMAEEFRHDLEDQCVRMNLKRRTINDCLELFDEYVRAAPTLPRSQKLAIMLGVIFHGCRKNDDTRTVQELARQTQRPEKEVRNGMKLVSRRCNAFDDKRKVEPIKLISRYCQNLRLKPEFMNMFVTNAQTVGMHINQYLEGRKANTVAATDIVLTFRWFYDGKCVWDEAQIAQLSKLKVTTLRKSIAKVEEEMKKDRKTVAEIIADAESQRPVDS